MWQTIPNLLTLLRFMLIPAFVVSFFMPGVGWRILALILFMVAYFTDWLDGFLARKLSQVSQLGAFLDPIADKLLVAAGLIVVLTEHPTAYYAVPTVLIIGREIVISSLREWMARLGKSELVAVDNVGKVKTVFQGLSLVVFISQPSASIGIIWAFIGYILLYIALGLTLWSMLRYFMFAWSAIKKAM
jgi:CDP-diacylglycerol--glycerol-3-phosphate 3-phosphatidyltransferase